MTNIFDPTSYQYYINYPDVENLNVITSIATKFITAYKNQNGTPQDLVLAASSNVLIQSINDIYLQHSNDRSINISDASATYLSITRSNARPIITDTLHSGITIDTQEIRIGHTTFSENSNPETLTLSLDDATLSNGIIVDADVLINRQLQVQEKTIAHGGTYSPHVGIYKNSIRPGFRQLGYFFSINAKEQLELVKYTYSNGSSTPILKRAGVFGLADMSTHDFTSSNESFTPHLVTSTA